MARLNTFDPDLDLTHIYCLYAVTPQLTNRKPFVDQRVTKFGETALLIIDPGEFIRRIEKTTKEQYNCVYGPVHYYPDNEGHTKLNIFDNPCCFCFKREFRFHFDYSDKDDLKFEIGPIH